MIKLVGVKPEEALYLLIDTPLITLEQIANTVMAALQNVPVEYSFKWAQMWGQTRVVFGKGPSVFAHEKSVKVRRYKKLETTSLIEPILLLSNFPKNRPYYITLNNLPSTLEGIVLQVERLVDELIWCLGIEYRNQGLDPVEAYSQALQNVSANGFDIYLQDQSELLEAHRQNPRLYVRIYGNKNNRGKVPNVIGAVATDGNYDRPEFKEPQFKILELPQVVRRESLDLPNADFLLFGICIAKQPHLGHMLLGAVVETARRSLNPDTPVILNANDTGPRIAQMLARCAEEKAITIEEAAAIITNPETTSEQVQSWYQQRGAAQKPLVVEAEDLIRAGGFTMMNQALEYVDLFGKFLGSKSLSVVAESTIDRNYSPVDTLNQPEWLGSGFSTTEINGKTYVLEANGLPSASSMRSACMLIAASQMNRGNPVYIDSDSSIQEAIQLLHEDTGIEANQFPGAAIGFGFSIGSGTEGNSINMRNLMAYFSEEAPNRVLIDDLVFLINNRYQLQPNNGLAFFDYLDQNSFINDLNSIPDERYKAKQKMDNVLTLLKQATSAEAAEVSFALPKDKGNRLKHRLSQLLSLENPQNLSTKIFLRQDSMSENPQVQSLIDKIARHRTSEAEARIEVLTKIARRELDLESNIVNQLIQHGYSNENLIQAIIDFVNGNYAFTRFNNIVMQTIKSIEEIVPMIDKIDGETARRLQNLYITAYERLLNIYYEQ